MSCSSVLVRILAAPKSDDGLTVLSRDDFEKSEWEKNGLTSASPLYSSGVYDSTRCLPRGIEEKLYGLRRHRSDVPLREFVLKELTKIEPDKDIQSITEEEMKEHIMEKIAEKPRNMVNYCRMVRTERAIEATSCENETSNTRRGSQHVK